MIQRKSERFDYFVKVYWDFFAQRMGKKSGYLGNISISGCLLKTNEIIDHRRWVKLIITEDTHRIYFTAIGRVVRKKNAIEMMDQGSEFTLYHYGIEFTHPNYFSLATTDLILALSKRNLSVRSCLNLNSKSAFRPGFLA